FQNGQLTVLPHALMNGTVCEYLQMFAQASTKPTDCPVTQYTTQKVELRRRFRVKRAKLVNGKNRIVTPYVYRTTRTTRRVGPPGPPGPCFTGSGSWAGPEPTDYDAYVEAILALAHETAHLNGDIGTVQGGVQYGEVDFEAEAQCHGL